MSVLRLLRTLHGWLGFIVFPWIIMIGATGLYLNHDNAIDAYLPAATYDEDRFDDWPTRVQLRAVDAEALAGAIWPGVALEPAEVDRYHGRDVYVMKSDDGRIIVTRDTGHYWIKTRYRRETHDPEGQLLDTKIYWGSLFKKLHRAGWYDSSFGTWASDIAGGAMVLFGLTGIFLFLVPRIRRMLGFGRRKPMHRRRDWPARENPL